MYTLPQVAKDIGLSYNTVKSYVRKGYIKASKVGRDWLVDEHEYKRLKDKYLTNPELLKGETNV